MLSCVAEPIWIPLNHKKLFKIVVYAEVCGGIGQHLEFDKTLIILKIY